ncbi:2-keto-4-pentenoate hydratase/2-oxohepta-3-ene-1,7-dioic acid hydratase-like protein [Pontimonas salivibrio]|uniref:2-keto-4-pentenoate hydratase/2-oxohepta-3-ene-1,7-dioic acid hydratase-like protein n=1 Tax=Pontimonas salivibrio TaxID=1159327 RepID=A0A2L2BRL6_9MICO|nr:fumarylacetoacetate hydrolase family protein [Pontimonas salivibrio]AVG24301.1 2-keto-4-pentenoate hydratase/2-oxohepta-3-ene-1,7-dioic acid hydratase-like protein [Pontimonas salivibrio]
MRIGRVGNTGHEKPVVFVDDKTAVAVDSIISDWSRETLESGALESVKAASLESLPTIDLTDVRIGAPVARPTKVVCIGLNYRKHAAETGATPPTEPVIFMKAPDCVVGPNDDIEIPPGSEKTDYEVELAIVIGSRLRYATSQEKAMKAVLGYTISQDVSERHWQIERGGQWDKGKAFPTFNPCGPWIETDTSFDPQNQVLSCSVNGESRQDSNTNDMIFTVAEIVHYVSQCMELFPGDIINTGTPAGVAMGMNPTQYLVAGDVVETTIEGIGTIRSTCVEANLS